MSGVKMGRTEGVPRLPYDAVFRIEVSLSSQTTSAIVMRTTARLYCLEGARSTTATAGDAEWRSLAYGAPCIQLIRHGNRAGSGLFAIKLVIAEVESGISLWEAMVEGSSHYAAMQSNFHTFAVDGSTYAIQFASDEEASRMLESMQDLLSQRQRLETAATQQPQVADPAVQPVVFKKPSKPPRRLSKKEISAPCNFKHVSGITMQRTQSCEQELRGTIQRKMRSLSLSNLYRHKARDEGGQPGDGAEEETAAGRRPSKKGKSAKRRPGKDSPDSAAVAAKKQVDPRHMSLPSHYRQKERPAVSQGSFLPPSSSHPPHSLNRTLSHSSGDIPAVIAQPDPHPPTHHNPHSSTSSHRPHPQSSGHSIQRRHTMLEHSPGRRPINHSPIAVAPPTVGTMTRPSLSDMSLNRIPLEHGPGRRPINHSPIAVAPPTVGTMTRPSLSDMSLNRIPHQPVAAPVRQQRQGPSELRPVQRVAIAESDIIGWTPDGRLIVQMPVGAGASQSLTTTRRGSTGLGPFPSDPHYLKTSVSTGALQGSSVFPTHLPPPSPTRGAPHHGVHLPPPSPTRGAPHHGVHLPPPSPTRGAPQHLPPPEPSHGSRSRPLPPTPLDIAMPQSQALRRGSNTHRPHAVANGNRTPMADALRPPVTLATSQAAVKMNGLPITISPQQPPAWNRQPVALGNRQPATVEKDAALQTPSHPHTIPTAPSHPHTIPTAPLPTNPPSPQKGSTKTTYPPHSHYHSDSADAATLQEVTDQMSKALAEFDELLGVAQTTL